MISLVLRCVLLVPLAFRFGDGGAARTFSSMILSPSSLLSPLLVPCSLDVPLLEFIFFLFFLLFLLFFFFLFDDIVGSDTTGGGSISSGSNRSMP